MVSRFLRLLVPKGWKAYLEISSRAVAGRVVAKLDFFSSSTVLGRKETVVFAAENEVTFTV